MNRFNEEKCEFDSSLPFTLLNRASCLTQFRRIERRLGKPRDLDGGKEGICMGAEQEFPTLNN